MFQLPTIAIPHVFSYPTFHHSLQRDQGHSFTHSMNSLVLDLHQLPHSIKQQLLLTPHTTLTLASFFIELHALADSAQCESGPAQWQPEALPRAPTAAGLFQQALERAHSGAPTTFQQHAHPSGTCATSKRQAAPAPSARPQPRRHDGPLSGGAPQAPSHAAPGRGE